MASTVGSPTGLSRILPAFVGRMLEAVGVAKPAGVDAAAQLRRDELERQARYIQLMDTIMGRALPDVPRVPAPLDMLRARLADGERPRGFAPSPAESDGEVGRSVQRALTDDPLFRTRLELALGGRIVGGDPDRGLQVWKAPAPRSVPKLAQAPALASTAPAVVGGAAVPAPASGNPGLTVPLLNESRAPGLVEPSPAMGSILAGLQQLEANIMNVVQTRVAKDGSVPAAPMDQFGNLVGQTAAGLGPNATAGLSELPITGAMQTQLASAAQPGNPAAGAMSDTMKMQMLQNMMTALRRLYDQLSNILAQIHQMRSEAIKNIA